ncbi:MAG: penicillin acylase family protein [Vicinamibacterales bacterium]
MRASLLLASLLSVSVMAADGCRRTTPPPPPPHAVQVAGTLQVPGLHAPVSVVRDASGIPHITASNTDDLFFAQGFVQAQDRLFQMDLWKRASQGRLAEVLGSNFIERDAMTRRIRFRGNPDEEWAAYGPDTHQIAAAFVQGINAWVRLARTDLPEEFVLAGWTPEFWKPEDLLNRTDAFLAGGDALDELFRARLAGAIGAGRVDALLPLPDGTRTAADPGVDFAAITFVVPDAVRKIGTAPFVPALAARVTSAPRPNAELLAKLTAAAGESPSASRPAPDPATPAVPPIPALLRAGATAVSVAGAAADQRPSLIAAEFGAPDAPSRRYLVHLQAPGWNVIGATAPWMPGVAIGHNERIAWAFTPSRVDTQDIYVERFNPENPRQVRRGTSWVDMSVDYERIALKGRDEPFEYERQYTSNGVVIAIDKERHLLYTLRWSGTEPGGAGELAAPGVDRAQSFDAFQSALERWKMPAAHFLYVDVDGRTESAAAGRVPVRRTGTGAVPRAGWLAQGEWTGWTTPVARAFVLGPGVHAVSSEVLHPISAGQSWGVNTPGLPDAAHVWNEPIPLDVEPLGRLARVGDLPPDSASLRARLLPTGRADASTTDRAFYAAWLTSLRWGLTEGVVPTEFRQGAAALVDFGDFDIWSFNRHVSNVGVVSTRDVMSVALIDAASRAGKGSGVTFQHPLAAFDISKTRFNIGPVPLPGAATLEALSGGRLVTYLAMQLVPGEWNQSLIRTGPGQSGSPASQHYDDAAIDWSNNRTLNMLFDQFSRSGDAAVLQLEPVSR